MAALAPLTPLNGSNCNLVDEIDGEANWPDNALEIIYGLTIASAILSLLGSLFILITYHSIYGSRLSTWLSCVPWLSCLHCHRADGSAVLPPNSTSILYYIAVCDIVVDLCYIIDAAAVDHRTPEQHERCPRGKLGATSRDGVLCPLLGGIGQFFGLGVILWTGALAVGIQAAMKRRTTFASTTTAGPTAQINLMRSCHWFIWGCAGASVLTVIANNGLGSAGSVCWITDKAAWARLILFYFPLIAVLIFTAYTYGKLRSTLAMFMAHGAPPRVPPRAAPPTVEGSIDETARGEAAAGHTNIGSGAERRDSTTGGSSSDVLSALTRRFGAYIIVFVIVWTFPILNRIRNLLDPEHPSLVLFIGAALFTPMQGLGNAFIYGWTPSVRDHYRQVFGRRPTAALARACTTGPWNFFSSRSVSRSEIQPSNRGLPRDVTDRIGGDIQISCTSGGSVYDVEGGVGAGAGARSHTQKAFTSNRGKNTRNATEYYVTDEPL